MKKQRMYSIAMRHLSGIQKGIQSWHAGQHYANEYGNTKEFKQWAKIDETVIVLEAHSTNTLLRAKYQLEKLGIKVVGFKEPDLDNITTAIAFLLPDDFRDSDDPTMAAAAQIVTRYPLASN